MTAASPCARVSPGRARRRAAGALVVSGLWAASFGAALGPDAPAAAATLREPVLGLSAESRYDSFAAVGQRADLLNILAPALGYQQKSEVGHLEVTYSPEFISHLRVGNLTTDHVGRLDWSLALSRRLTLQATAGFWRVEDSTMLPRFGITRVPAPALYAVGDLLGRYRLAPLDRIELRYRGEASRLYQDGLPLGTDHGLSAGWVHALVPRLEAGLRYRYVLFTEGLKGAASTHTVALVARYQLTRHSFLDIEAGPMAFRSTHSPDTTPSVFGLLEYGWDARGVHLGLTAGRDYVGSAGYATTIWADYVEAEASRHLTRQLSVNAGGGLFLNGEAPSRPVETRGYVLSVGGEWRFTPSLRAALSVDRIGQFAGAGDVAGAQLARSLIGARLVWRTP